MTDRRVRVILELVTAGYESGAARAAKSTDQITEAAKRAVEANSRLTSEEKALARERDKITADIERSAERQRAAADRVSTTMLTAGAAILAGVGLTAKAAMDWESQFAGVRKTVDGTGEQIRALEGDLRGMARSMATSHEEIAATAEAAGQLGVATEDVASFTRTMLMLGETTNLTADEAATSIAQISNIMGTASTDIGRFASTLVLLGNNGASTEAEILNLANRIAGAAQIVGVSEQGVLALSNAMASVGINAELGGSAMSRAMIGMNTAVLSGGERLEAFAQISSMTAEEFSAAWKADPTKAVQAFVSGLDRINEEGGNAVDALGEVGLKGTQNTQVFLALAGAHEMLADSIAMGADAWATPTALLDEYAQRANTTAFKTEVAWNTIKDAAITAGSATLPVVAGLADGIAGLASTFSSLPQGAQNTAVAIAAIGGAGLVAVGGTMKLLGAAADLKSDLSDLGVDFGALKGKMGDLPWGKIALGAAAAAAAIAIASVAIGEWQRHATAGISAADQVATSMENLGKKGASLSVAQVQVDNLNAALKNLGMNQVDGVGGLFKSLGDDARTGLAGVREGFDGLLFGMRTQAGLVRDEVDKIDAALAGMASGGQLASAQMAFTKLSDAAMASGESVEFVAEQFPQFRAALETTAAALDVTGLSATDYANWMRGDVPDAIQAAVSAGGPLVSNLTDQQRALVETASAAELHASALRETSAAQAQAAQGAAGLIGGLTGMEAAFDSAAEAAKKNGQNLDANTEAGRNNLNALAGIVGQTGKYVEQLEKAGASQAELDAAMTRGREQFIAAAIAMDGTSTSAEEARAKAEALADEMGLIPNQVTTLFNTPGADVSKQQARDMETAVKRIPSLAQTSILAPGARPSKAEVDAFIKSVGDVPGLTTAQIRTIADLYGVRAAQEAIDSVRGKTVQVVVNYKATGVSSTRVASAYASGGHVTGPGSGTSDSILALVSNGEYIIKAASVAKLGLDRLHWLNEHGSLPRFATGGAVQPMIHYAPSYTPPPSFSASSQSSRSAPGLSAEAIRAALDGATLRLGSVDPITRHLEATLVTSLRRH